MPALTQLLSIELCRDCNLGHVHTACPNKNAERYAHTDTHRVLNDGMIVRFATRFYKRGFTGLVAWHYYNEPLLAKDRMFLLMRQIKAITPQARFLLWTNGTLLPADCSDFAAFGQIHVTDYTQSGHRPVNIPSLRRACANVQVHSWPLDKRLVGLGAETSTPCTRPFTEFIVDYFGNVHPCCYDWRGLASVGNVFTSTFDTLIERWGELRRAMCREAMTANAPEACRRCQLKCGGITSFDQEAKARAIAWRQAMLDDPPRRNLGRPAVVFVFYRNRHSSNPIPLQRLADHFAWNDNFYRESRCRVIVVTAEQHDVPAYAECVIFPKEQLPTRNGKPVFSLSRTKNAGIAAAVKAGFDPIIVTDPDIAYTAKAWQRCLDVATNEAAVPVYWMASSFANRNERCHIRSTKTNIAHFSQCSKSHEDLGATGMVAMCRENWERIRYDDRCCGYGAEDGFLLQEIRRAKLRELRDTVIYHIAHVPGMPQANFTIKGFERQDSWDMAFNPINFTGNHRAHAGG
ncbi:MAG: SPASM domain-containing protein [Parcubacteria group bacterium]|jgi:hypothetical protein